MPHVNTVSEDGDYQSFSSSVHSDDNISEFDYHDHRSCRLNASCGKRNHRICSLKSLNLKNNSSNSKPIKDDIRLIENEPGHQQKYDGRRWRRICSASKCSIYLSGALYYDNWLCRKHYLLSLETDQPNECINSTIKTKRSIVSQKKNLQTTTVQQLKKDTKYYKRGDMMVNNDGTRQKFDGICWRSVCTFNDCKSFIATNGFCSRHSMENRNITSALSLPVKKTQKKTSIPKSHTKQSIKLLKMQPKKGEIRFVRQQYNGTKWYSLCHYNSGTCPRRSAGSKSSYLCEKHFKEYKNKGIDQPIAINSHDPILLSPTIKRKKSINNDHMLSTNFADESNRLSPYETASSINVSKPIEQCIQTDVTYPVDSVDLRQGCILIEEDNDELHQNDSPQLMVYIKKEEVTLENEDYPTTKQKLTFDVTSMPINCKSELTKFETY